MSGIKVIFATLCLVTGAVAPTALAHADPIFVGILQLHERDLNGDGVVDSYYDSVFGLTWLRDWNYLHSRQPTIPGLVNWPTAIGFAEFAGTDSRFDPALGGHYGWRLPTMQEYRFVVEALSFMENVQGGDYWSSDVYPYAPEYSWAFEPLGPTAILHEYTDLLHVALVRAGDVPEPPILTLISLALFGMATTRLRVKALSHT